MHPGIPENYSLILASRSPRRHQLLRDAGLEVKILLLDFDESYPHNLKGKEIAEYLSRSKALSIADSSRESEIYITADTIVWCADEVLDKPKDFDDAVRILRLISGNTHEVITGVSLLSAGIIHTFSESTLVTFDLLSDEDIYWYINNYKPFDKAGAYGIQEWIGITGNSRIEGSFFNVMGLPVNRLIKELGIFINGKIIKR